MENNEKYIITLDSGTTSCRSLIVNKKGEIIAIAQNEFSQYFPKSGWVEHDPLEIWNTQLSTMQSVKNKAQIKSSDIVALGITNQRETIVVWDKDTGLPVYNAIVWQDVRTSSFCDQMIAENKTEFFREKTGLIINPYFSATKLKWILENVPLAKEKLAKGKLLAGTIDTWLIWKLTGGKVHASDVSNASRTMLFNIHSLDWDQEILDYLKIPRSILPKVQASSEFYGFVQSSLWSNKAKGKVPITGVAGDQQSALFGQMCTEVGMVKNTYGTGCFTLVNTGQKPVNSKNRLLTTIAWKLGNEKTIYALEGSVFVAGAAIQWLRDSLRILYNAALSDFYSSLVKDNQRVYVVPAFTGLGAPYWDSYAKGAIFGLERGTKNEHIIKATLESIAYQSNDLIKAMEKDLGQKITLLKVDGGASKSDYLMNFQASISNLDVHRPANVETTALGAAYLAGLAVGFWKDIKEIQKMIKIDHQFKPSVDQKEVDVLLKGWNEAVKRVLNWQKDIE
ncbi:GLYCEROL KINASE (ATP:GLYCEROL 3-PHOSPHOTRANSFERASE) (GLYCEROKINASE) (GK) [Mycoplasmopsis pulmonis]|uniref:Glycerol kinase n=1 Tax=Mycoplasmopsis pulmonis (strain UAB CTIP) TaxID=272635 RepID=GLPK_MYCPU|nr:glycerol kinase GlpK [Mycoplasmopsis pulmonis]Q98QY9.1 RecName: Full=Glycerol kinase; AltName: Full=ATP:glycerol 3-phosphotransferase; AltName: Full=Glycerokinase; Short=GK [Mycoplasmopsis pulmonis UAB CTIP]MDZ7293184.1 glycerol kinase GlpK [Mycoplasmopsis pulmonis]CAC13394.1 GLYCEROL KINASE (ATP:GLYCEROL 3-PHOSPHOTRANSFERASE) (GLYCEROKINASE) (GK) [Mycoplasmopsis pulmonis]